MNFIGFLYVLKKRTLSNILWFYKKKENKVEIKSWSKAVFEFGDFDERSLKKFTSQRWGWQEDRKIKSHSRQCLKK